MPQKVCTSKNLVFLHMRYIIFHIFVLMLNRFGTTNKNKETAPVS